jgi:hypothetical protein
MSITVSSDQKEWNKFVDKVNKNLSEDTIDKLIQATAFKGLRLFVAAYPKRTGSVARGWKALKKGIGSYEIVNFNKVALFLEEGTKAHGPRRAKFLYIPLRPGAAVWRQGFVFGQDYILVKRVKGIKPLNKLTPISEQLLVMMVKDFEKQIDKAAA